MHFNNVFEVVVVRWWIRNQKLPLNDESLGSHNDEERREMRYVMRIAGLSESSNLWTQIAAPTISVGAYLVQTLSTTTTSSTAVGRMGRVTIYAPSNRTFCVDPSTNDSNRSRYCSAIRSVAPTCQQNQNVWSWAQVRRPAEFKHITKRRKRN